MRSRRPGFLSLLSFFVLLVGFAPAQPASPEERDLVALVGRQRELFARAAEADDQAGIDDLRPSLQRLAFDYEAFLRDHPQSVTGLAAYALFLGSELVDERRHAIALWLKANELDPNVPLVKNQIGNYLAEDGKPLEAINYFISAAQLEPDEPLYHYQIGVLLSEARTAFLTSGDWSETTVARTAQEALARAHELRPDNYEYAYRYAQSFYLSTEPNWTAALAAWDTVARLAATDLGRQTARLQRANVLIQLGETAAARATLATVTDPNLVPQREELAARLDGKAKPTTKTEQD